MTRPVVWLVAAVAAILLSVLAAWVQADLSMFASWPWSIAQRIAAPGTTIWWLTLGGPFRTVPTTAGGIAFAGLANAASWLVAARLIVALFRAFAGRGRR